MSPASGHASRGVGASLLLPRAFACGGLCPPCGGRPPTPTLCTEVRFDFGGETPPSPPLLLPAHPPFWSESFGERQHEGRNAFAGNAHPPFLSESLGNLCTKDAPPRLWRNCPLATSARKTRRPALRLPTHPFPLRPLATEYRRALLRCLRRRGAGGWVGSSPPPTLPHLAFALHVGGKAPHTPQSFCPPTQHLCTSAAFAWRCFGARLRVDLFGLRLLAARCRRTHFPFCPCRFLPGCRKTCLCGKQPLPSSQECASMGIPKRAERGRYDARTIRPLRQCAEKL